MNIGIVITAALPETQSLPLRKQLPEPSFYERLTEAGTARHMYIFVFRACDFNATKKTLVGYRYEHGQWHRKLVPLPDIVIDRAFHQHKLQFQKHHKHIKELEDCHYFLYLNAQLPNKLLVYEQLKAYFPSLIPPSQQYEHFSLLQTLLNKYEAGVILKPISGMHGKGIIHVQKNREVYSINGRQLNNQPISTTFSSSLSLQKWLLYFRQNISYLIQPYYAFRTADNEPFDIRVLMQKDEKGVWKLSGSVARIGQRDTLTSNLHGGGKSDSAISVLEKLFDGQEPAHLLEQIHMISGQMAEQLEACFGRFGELAFDFGITTMGNIVLLECNSKPGRQAFLDDAKYADIVISAPLSYASYLHQHYIEQKKHVHLYKSTSILY